MNFLCCWNDGPQLQNRLCNIHMFTFHISFYLKMVPVRASSLCDVLCTFFSKFQAKVTP